MKRFDLDLDTLAERIVDGEAIELLGLSSPQKERLDDLVDEDEQEALLANVLNLVYLDGELGHLEKDRARRDSYRETSDMCRELAGRIGDWGRLNHILTLLSKYFAGKAERTDPKGKKPRRVTATSRIAEALVFVFWSEQLTMRPATNPNSDFAKLYRLLCEMLDVAAPKNVSFHLKPHLEKISEGKWGEVPEEAIKKQICELIGMEYPPFLDNIQDDIGS